MMGASGERNGPSRRGRLSSPPGSPCPAFPSDFEGGAVRDGGRVFKKASQVARLYYRGPFASSGGFRSEFAVRSKSYGRVVPEPA